MVKYLELIQEARESGSRENWLRAIALYEEAFEIAIDIDDYLDYGLAHLQIGDKVRAEDIIQNALLENEDNPNCYYIYGMFYEETNQIDKAIQMLEKANELILSADYLFDLARLYDEVDKEKAIITYQKALKLDPNHYWANLNLGCLYEEMQENETALIYLLQAKNIDENGPMLNYNLGVVYAKVKQYDKAIECYQKAIDDSSDLACFNIAILYKDYYKDYKMSKYYYLEAIKRNKNDYRFWYNLGCLYAIIDDYSNAIECLKYAAYLEPKVTRYISQDPELQALKNKCLD